MIGAPSKAEYMRGWYYRNRSRVLSRLWSRRNGADPEKWIPREDFPRRYVKVRRYHLMVYSLLRQRDGDLCALCGLVITSGQESVDHVRRLVHGGTDEADNLRLVHRGCNNSSPKGSWALEQAGVSF